MHDLHLIHTDLKPENILLVSSEYIKVPDYKVITVVKLLTVICAVGCHHSFLLVQLIVFFLPLWLK